MNAVTLNDPATPTPLWLESSQPEALRVEQFLRFEAYLLDTHRFSEWLDLYTADARYWVPLEANQADPFHTHSIIYDDKHLMAIRVRQQQHPRAHARLPLARTVHQVGNVLLLDGGQGGELTVASSLVLAEYRQERQRFFAATVAHQLRRRGQGYEIASKRIDLINSESELDGIAFIL